MSQVSEFERKRTEKIRALLYGKIIVKKERTRIYTIPVRVK